MGKYYYVYILRSKLRKDKTYIGYTTNLKERLKKHNEGGNKSTFSLRPWEVQTTIAFDDKEKAIKFEKYLKTGSGRAFLKRHF